MGWHRLCGSTACHIRPNIGRHILKLYKEEDLFRPIEKIKIRAVVVWRTDFVNSYVRGRAGGGRLRPFFTP